MLDILIFVGLLITLGVLLIIHTKSKKTSFTGCNACSAKDISENNEKLLAHIYRK